MADDERNALVVQGPRSLAEVGAGARKILSNVVSDALTVASSREKALSSTPFRIGDYELRQSDYTQILNWAKALTIDSETLIKRLENISFTPNVLREKMFFTVEKGAIVSLSLDVVALPLKNFDWVTGLSILDLAVFREVLRNKNISLSLSSVLLSSLRSLFIRYIELIELDLSKVPNLTELWCDRNQLTDLDLSKVPNLAELWCDLNQLTELDLSRVPNLTILSCGINQLTELDISNAPNLTRLSCMRNKLTELDLSNVPNLSILFCHGNILTELYPSNVPQLTNLDCSANQISELDLSAVPNLTILHCEKNLITELDVTANRALTELHCDGSVRIVKLPNQNFNMIFDEVNNTLSCSAVPPDDAGITEIFEAEFQKLAAFVPRWRR
jgi:hypothetical protein